MPFTVFSRNAETVRRGGGHIHERLLKGAKAYRGLHPEKSSKPFESVQKLPKPLGILQGHCSGLPELIAKVEPLLSTEVLVYPMLARH
jgi:hypothetical protein